MIPQKLRTGMGDGASRDGGSSATPSLIDGATDAAPRATDKGRGEETNTSKEKK